MVKFLCAILFFFHILSSGKCQGKVFIVSDIDDTLKINQGLDLKGVLYFLRDEKDVQQDLLVLFREMESRGATFIYLSSSFKYLYDASEWLEQAGFPTGSVFQRDENSSINGKFYKKNKLREIILGLNLQSDDSIHFFGDNLGGDDSVYAEVVSELNLQAPSRIYIRDVLLSQLTPFVEIKTSGLKDVNYFISMRELSPQIILWLMEGEISLEAYVLLNLPYYSKNSISVLQKENMTRRLKHGCAPRDLSCDGRSTKRMMSFVQSYYQF